MSKIDQVPTVCGRCELMVKWLGSWIGLLGKCRRLDFECVRNDIGQTSFMHAWQGSVIACWHCSFLVKISATSNFERITPSCWSKVRLWLVFYYILMYWQSGPIWWEETSIHPSTCWNMHISKRDRFFLGAQEKKKKFKKGPQGERWMRKVKIPMKSNVNQ